MLIDYRTLVDFIVPAVVVVGVFMGGKIAANTVGSILAGRSPGDSLRVGMTMPQMGEFSLAIGPAQPIGRPGSVSSGGHPLHRHRRHIGIGPVDCARLAAFEPVG